MKNSIFVISVIIGSLIGAGFASGKEIELFFCRYGIHGLVGILISSCFIGIIIYIVFHLSNRHGIETYDQFLDVILDTSFKGKGKIKTGYKRMTKNIMNLFLLMSFFIMVAGFGSYFQQEFSITPIIGSMVLSSLCYITFQKGIEGITKVSSLLIPILIGYIVWLGLKQGIAIPKTSIDISTSKLHWLFSSLLYASYNTILVIPILFSLKSYIKNQTRCKKICILSVFIILLSTTIIYGLILQNQRKLWNVEIPMVAIASTRGTLHQYLYGGLILVAIYTSAITAGYSFLQNAVGKPHQKWTSIFLCIFSIFISFIGFSSLVEVLYPVFGGLGLLQIYQILKCLKTT